MHDGQNYGKTAEHRLFTIILLVQKNLRAALNKEMILIIDSIITKEECIFYEFMVILLIITHTTSFL